MHTTTWSTFIHLEQRVDDTEHTIDPEPITELEEHLNVCGNSMTQYNLKLGMRKFGARGEKALVAKLAQFLNTWTAIDVPRLNREETMEALMLLLFIKEKQTRTIKGKVCINWTPQQDYISKEEAGFPTVSAESTFISAVIAANKKRKVRCYNVSSAFVNTDVDDNILMVLKRDLVEMLLQIAPQVTGNVSQ
jgi:hypothetical protein